MTKIRLDKLLVKRKLCLSREKAITLIKDSKVKVNGEIITKGSREFDENSVIEHIEEEKQYVGRGAKKLLKAVSIWDIHIKNKICADFGASTGGFTEVLLENGAKKVYSIDVGHGQLAEKLKKDKRVINMEKVNLKNVNSLSFNEKFEIIVCDLSFISILKVLDTINNYLVNGGQIITLVKPQFELTKKDLGKDGVVKDAEKQKNALDKVIENFEKKGFKKIKTAVSPIKGASGNKEFLLYGIKGV